MLCDLEMHHRFDLVTTQGITSLDSFGEGRRFVETTEQREDMMERVRFFAEECDSMQVRRWSPFSCTGASLL